jgi:CitMHS family citrate-Mg2+:H+ or citrate-Ca2+:H+ symporter
MLSNSILNIAPWGGPTARVMTVVKLDASQVFLPLIPGMAMASLATLAIAWYLGVMERKRIGLIAFSNRHSEPSALGGEVDIDPTSSAKAEKSAIVKAFNFLLTLTLMVLLVSGLVPLALLFMVAYGVAMTVNFPKLSDQKECMARHAASALSVVSVIFAAGVFTGILSGTKMTDAIAHSIIQMIPASAGTHLPLITAMLSAPFTFFISNDAFYFGVVPVLAEAAKGYGIAPEVIARASLIGQPVHQLSPLVAANYVLIGLAGVEFGVHQRFTLKWAFLLMFVMLIVAGILGVVPLLH